LGRILLVTFQQALRSVALTLLPLSFIALFAWSTAGSTSGNTSDPIRAAIWIWLGSHLIPFKLALTSAFSNGALTFLPIGALVFPWLAIRSGFRRASDFLSNPRGARTFIALWYTAIATLAAVLSQSENIRPNIILTPIFVLIISLSATIDYQGSFFSRFKLLTYLFLTLIGLAMIVIAISLTLHFEIVKSLAIVIQPGIMGGLLFTLLQILYLPNIALAGISYLFGPGFSLGLGTQISPTNIDVSSLPAIPILGALPTSEHPILLFSLIAALLIILLNQLAIFRNFYSFKTRQGEIIKSVLPLIILLIPISFFASGELLTHDMNPVGIAWWKLPAIFLGAQSITIIIGLYIPKLIKVIKAHKSEL
jgi:hypothetical protein